MSDHGGGGEDLRERPMGELLRELSEQTTTLVRQELELAKSELAEKAKRGGIGAGMFGGAGLSGLLAAGTLTTAVLAALDEAMPLWAAALIVTAIYGLVAAALALSGKRQMDRATPAAPGQMVESVKEDVEWARTRAQSARR